MDDPVATTPADTSRVPPSGDDATGGDETDRGRRRLLAGGAALAGAAVFGATALGCSDDDADGSGDCG